MQEKGRQFSCKKPNITWVALEDWTMGVKYDMTKCTNHTCWKINVCMCKEYLQENKQLIRHQKHECFQKYIGYEQSSELELIS